MMKRLLGAALVSAALLAGCGGQASEPPKPQPAAGSVPAKAPMKNLAAADLLKQVKAGTKPFIVDVRTQEEWDAGHIDGARLVPLQTLEQGIKSIPKDQAIVLICRSGNRSAQAYEILAGMGYTNLTNVTGGMMEWEKLGGPVIKK